METRKFLKRLPFVMSAAAFACSAMICLGPAMTMASDSADTQKDAPAAVEKKAEENVFKGSIKGFSKKAKTIAIEVGKGDKAKTMIVKFDDETKGLEFAKVGDAAIINFDKKGNDKVATVIKPKLAKLPEGVTEISPEELKSLVAMGPEAGKFFLVDSRPGKRYEEGHIASSVSIPVEKLKKEGAALLPEDKDAFLIFHCGGPT